MRPVTRVTTDFDVITDAPQDAQAPRSRPPQSTEKAPAARPAAQSTTGRVSVVPHQEAERVRAAE